LFGPHSKSEINLSDNMGVEPMTLLHGCASQSKLTEGHRLRLFTGSGLTRSHLSKSARKRAQKTLCKWCAKAKMTRTSFTERDDVNEYQFCEYNSVDISVYLNSPSRLVTNTYSYLPVRVLNICFPMVLRPGPRRIF
jgi:hypothetical protein